ncbi:hypothetical protein C8A00DRAFT_40324 [Chaetomidium leptoderma]|uniref:Uncharacterized protein n=1 Tax=Chaetomidium leptoderma TaxID=669021 RepID=A0AAN6VVE5_9PEZI|nr:hypothetical protein C8A00DRAFT_40324 [Chaetomidium leptoderma]
MAYNSAVAGSSLLHEPVVYHDLKAWLEQQELNPKPLSPLQHRAIGDLRRSLEPDISDRDWVSLLNRYLQAHGGGTPKFDDESAPDDKWVYHCHFPPTAGAEPMTFPNAEAGYTTPSSPPGFGRKKDAKQYAAKCGIEWLMKGGYMPTDGQHVEFPKGKATANSPQTPKKKPPAPPQGGGGGGPTTTTTVTKGGNDNNNNNDDDEPPATQRVTELCQLMGLVVPQYKITPAAAAADNNNNNHNDNNNNGSSHNAQFFDGQADFGVDAIKVPEDLGRVANVYGKKNARERVAEEVLLWLVQEERRRVAEVDAMMAQEV